MPYSWESGSNAPHVPDQPRAPWKYLGALALSIAVAAGYQHPDRLDLPSGVQSQFDKVRQSVGSLLSDITGACLVLPQNRR